MLRLLFALLLALGSAALGLGWQVHDDEHAAAAWLPVEATVVDLQVRSPLPLRGPGGVGPGVAPGHIPLVVYAWEVDGQTFRSTRYRLGEALALAENREAAWAALSAYEIGQNLTAYRHPTAPERAVLDRGGTRLGLWLTALGALMLIVGLIGVWRAEHLAHALRRRSRDAQTPG